MINKLKQQSLIYDILDEEEPKFSLKNDTASMIHSHLFDPSITNWMWDLIDPGVLHNRKEAIADSKPEQWSL